MEQDRIGACGVIKNPIWWLFYIRRSCTPWELAHGSASWHMYSTRGAPYLLTNISPLLRSGDRDNYLLPVIHHGVRYDCESWHHCKHPSFVHSCMRCGPLTRPMYTGQCERCCLWAGDRSQRWIDCLHRQQSAFFALYYDHRRQRRLHYAWGG